MNKKLDSREDESKMAGVDVHRRHAGYNIRMNALRHGNVLGNETANKRHFDDLTFVSKV